MRRVLGGSLSAIVLSLGWWACGGGNGAPASPSTSNSTSAAPSVTAVAVSGTAPHVGSSTQFAANATMSNGTTQIVTNQATWQSSSPSIATVNSSGLMAGLAAGEIDITATYQTISGKMHIGVSPLLVTVSGTVTDATSGAPLSGITVAGGGKAVVTDPGGKYSMVVAAGSVDLVVSGSGYVTTEKIITVTADTRMDFALARTLTPIPTPTPTPTPSPIAAPGLPSRTPARTCSLDSIVHPASCVNESFGNATAICNDGARSCSANNSGTCSSHTGVYCWVCPGTLCPQ